MPRKSTPTAKRKTDTANPDWSARDFARAKPAAETVPGVVAAWRRGRGPQASPTKVAVSIRLSPEVVAYFKATGSGWQSRLDQVLRGYVARR